MLLCCGEAVGLVSYGADWRVALAALSGQAEPSLDDAGWTEVAEHCDIAELVGGVDTVTS